MMACCNIIKFLLAFIEMGEGKCFRRENFLEGKMFVLMGIKKMGYKA